MGSCFAQNMGKRMLDNKFHAYCNPFGIIFNPLSIFELLQLAATSTELPGNSYVQNEKIWFNYKIHSGFSDPNKATLENKVNHALEKTSQFLRKTNLLILTFGTAWVYELKNTGMLVANCHKVPQHAFTKRLISPEEIISSFEQLLKTLKKIRPDLKCILTVSPVRHIKDTIPLNMVSKSILRLACHQLQENHPEIDYFPAYELLMDDLRDYRFYEKDMLHPNELAQEYVWQHFAPAYFDETTLHFLDTWKKIKSALNHRPFHPASEVHQDFLKNTLAKLEALSKTLDVTEEMATIKAQVIEN